MPSLDLGSHFAFIVLPDCNTASNNQFEYLENYLVSLESADGRQVFIEDILGTFVESFPLLISLWKI